MFLLLHFSPGAKSCACDITSRTKELTMMSQMQDQHQIGGKAAGATGLTKQRFCFHGDVPSNQSFPWDTNSSVKVWAVGRKAEVEMSNFP